MKKFLIAAAAVATLAAGGASAAQAKVHLDIHLGGFGGYGYGGGYYEPVGYYAPKCFKKKVKVVKYDYYGDPIVVWKTKKVCKKVWVGY